MGLLPILAFLFIIGAAFAYRKVRRPQWLGRTTERQIELLDRVPLTHQHSIHLISVRGRWLAVAVTPSGCSVLDSGVETENLKSMGAAR